MSIHQYIMIIEVKYLERFRRKYTVIFFFRILVRWCFIFLISKIHLFYEFYLPLVAFNSDPSISTSNEFRQHYRFITATYHLGV